MRAQKLVRWGNGTAIRIPKALLQETRLREGDTLVLSVRNGTIIARPAKKKPALRDLLSKVSRENVHAETDWGRPRGKEGW